LGGIFKLEYPLTVKTVNFPQNVTVSSAGIKCNGAEIQNADTPINILFSPLTGVPSYHKTASTPPFYSGISLRERICTNGELSIEMTGSTNKVIIKTSGEINEAL
jgi:hypothetical protein